MELVKGFKPNHTIKIILDMFTNRTFTFSECQFVTSRFRWWNLDNFCDVHIVTCLLHCIFSQRLKTN